MTGNPLNVECFWNKLRIDERSLSGCYAFGDPNTSDQMSFGPDKGVWCHVYIEKACEGSKFQVDWPGAPDLGLVGVVAADSNPGARSKFSSFSCGLYDCARDSTCKSFEEAEDGSGPLLMEEDEWGAEEGIPAGLS